MWMEQLWQHFRRIATKMSLKGDDLRRLHWDVAVSALLNADDIVARATLASRAELMSDGRSEDYRFLREMTFTLTAAATKLRRLRAERERGPCSKDPGEGG